MNLSTIRPSFRYGTTEIRLPIKHDMISAFVSRAVFVLPSLRLLLRFQNTATSIHLRLGFDPRHKTLERPGSRRASRYQSNARVHTLVAARLSISLIRRAISRHVHINTTTQRPNGSWRRAWLEALDNGVETPSR